MNGRHHAPPPSWRELRRALLLWLFPPDPPADPDNPDEWAIDNEIGTVREHTPDHAFDQDGEPTYPAGGLLGFTWAEIDHLIAEARS